MELERSTIGLLGVAISILLIFLRVPIGVAMGVVGLGGIAVLMSWSAAFGIAKGIPYSLIGDWNLSAVPMFLLMGYLASSTGLTNGLFKAARIFLGRVPGALASSTVMASALFSSASGSSVATAAAFSRIAIPEMLAARYQPAFACGSVAIAGTLGSLIPPSILMIVFGIMADTSIARLFIGGVVPGLLSALMFITYITLRAMWNPAIAPKDPTHYSREERRAVLREVWPLPVLIVGVLGGIFVGFVTPTEAGAIGAALTFIIAAARRALKRDTILQALAATAGSAAAIFIIVVGAAIFARFISYSQLPAAIADWLLTFSDSPIILMLAISLIYVLLGMVLESISIMLLTVPLLLPLLTHLNIDLVWFGLITVKLLEIGLCTPPVGMNVFVVKSSMGDDVSLTSIFRGTAGFLLVDFITLGLLLAFPQLTLWLPNLMGSY